MPAASVPIQGVPTPPTAAPGPLPLTRLPQRLAVTVGIHSVVDFFSFVIVSLLPTLASRLDLTAAEKATILAAGSIFSGFSQPLVAWLSDRLDTRALGTAGMALAVVSVGLYGFATSFWMLLGLAALAAMGIGSFHPPAAAAIGQLSGRRRSLGVAIFFLAGMLGGMAGNVLSPRGVQAMSVAAGSAGQPDVGAGLRALVWLIVPGLAGCLLLGRAIHRVGHRDHNHRGLRGAIPRAEMRLRWRAVALLYLGNIAKFTVNMALVYLYIQWIERWTLMRAAAQRLDPALALNASAGNGLMQAAMQLGMGAGGIALGAVLTARLEKPALVAIPLAGAGFIALFPHTDALAGSAPGAVMPLALALAAAGGIGFGGMIPVTIAIAQRLLPHRTGLASGMMMGGAWGFAAAGPFLAWWLEGAIGLDASFAAVAGLLAVPAALACFVPGELLRRAG